MQGKYFKFKEFRGKFCLNFYLLHKLLLFTQIRIEVQGLITFPGQNMIITQHIIIVYLTYLTLCIVHTYILFIFQQLNQLSSSFSGTWLSGSSLAAFP